MQSISNLPAPTYDLRAEAKDYQRDRNHNFKWARTGLQPRPAVGKLCDHNNSWATGEACTECAFRPQHRDFSRRCGRHAQGQKFHASHKNVGFKSTCARKAFRSEIEAATDDPSTFASDSSDGEDVKDRSAAPVPDAEIMYSYDATHGPGRGTDLLSHAVTQAIQRYENKQTEKLVKEYELVGGNENGYAADGDEDDFELIDHAHLV